MSNLQSGKLGSLSTVDRRTDNWSPVRTIRFNNTQKTFTLCLDTYSRICPERNSGPTPHHATMARSGIFLSPSASPQSSATGYGSGPTERKIADDRCADQTL